LTPEENLHVHKIIYFLVKRAVVNTVCINSALCC